MTLWVAGAAVLGCGAYAVLPGARSEADAAPAPAAGRHRRPSRPVRGRPS
ncbi:hypothetical protein [Streptomyces sp. SA3_actF]|nr:hypothetical protein [Streptomyces sp. SA3_actF]